MTNALLCIGRAARSAIYVLAEGTVIFVWMMLVAAIVGGLWHMVMA